MKKRKHFSQAELNVIMENYSAKGASYCAKLLKRSNKSIMAKAAKMGIKYDGVREKYLEVNLRPIIESAKTMSDVLRGAGVKYNQWES